MSALKPQNTRALARGAIIAALYTALTVLLAPLSYGEVQIRFSEAFTLLPMLMPEAVPALLTAGIGRRGHDLGRKILACLMPVLFNAVIVGAVITSAYNGLNIFSHPAAFALNAAQVGLGEAAVLFVIGLPMMYYLPGMKFFREFTIKLNS